MTKCRSKCMRNGHSYSMRKPRIAPAHKEQGIWILIFPDTEKRGIYQKQLKTCLSAGNFPLAQRNFQSLKETRMHSSRMHNIRCSGHSGGGCIPACTGQGCVSQHALSRGLPGGGGIWLGGVSQHALGRGVSVPVHAGILCWVISQ